MVVSPSFSQDFYSLGSSVVFPLELEGAAPLPEKPKYEPESRLVEARNIWAVQRVNRI